MSQAATPVFDRQLMIERLDGDESLLTEIIAVYLEERSALLDHVRRAIGGADTSEIAKAAHCIRGTLLNVAAPRAAAVATSLEQAARDDGGDFPALLEQLEGALREFDDALRAEELVPVPR